MRDDSVRNSPRGVPRGAGFRFGGGRTVRAVAAFAAGLLLLAGGAVAPAPVAAAPGPARAGLRVGLIVDADVPDGDAIAAGFRTALRAARVLGLELEAVERDPGADESETREALKEMSIDGAAAIVAVGERSARIAAEAVRDRPVVSVTAEPVEDVPVRVRRVAWTPEPSRVADEIRRLAPGARRIAVAGPVVGTADAIAAALAQRGGPADPARPGVDRLLWSDTTGSYGAEMSGADLVFASPETGTAEVTDLARRLSGQGVALVGARAAHLDAGAAVVLRPLPADVGALAAAAAAEALAGSGDAARVVRPRRLVREVHLANARRLGFVVPLSVLASSDRTVAPPPERR